MITFNRQTDPLELMSTDTSSVLSGGVYICWKLLAVFFHNFCIYLYFVHSLSHYLSVQAQIANPPECDWKCGFCKWNYWLCGSWLVESSSGIQYKYWEKAILESLSGCTVNLMWLRTFLKTGLLEMKQITYLNCTVSWGFFPLVLIPF